MAESTRWEVPDGTGAGGKERVRGTPGLLLLLLLGALPAGGAEARARPPDPARELQRRAVHITDVSIQSVTEVRVAAGTPTTLLFEGPVRPEAVLLADFKGWFFPIQHNPRSLVLVPKADLPDGEVVTLTVSLEEGTVLPFKLVSHPRLADLHLDVLVELVKQGAPESRQSLLARIDELTAQLAQARLAESRAGVTKVAALMLEQDPDRAQAFQVARHEVRLRDKQSRLLVEVRASYRLFNLVYVVLQVENRHASKTWAMGRAELFPSTAPTGSESLEVQVRAQLPTLRPEALGRVVLIFEPPPHTPVQSWRLTLHEKSGKRSIQLDGLRL